MPGKTYIAKQETSEATQADTTAIRNTLGDFPGGGIEDTVVKKLLELEGRIDEIAARQNYQDDDFYLDCSLNYTTLRFTKEQLSTDEQTVLDVEGAGVLRYLQRLANVTFKVYIDSELVFFLDGDTYNSTKSLYFGINALRGETNDTVQVVQDLSAGDLTKVDSLLSVIPKFKQRLRITAKKKGTETGTSNLFSVGYGIGGAAV